MIKKIFINGLFLNKKITGVERYGIELLKSLDSLVQSNDIDSNQYSFIVLTPRHFKYQLSLKNILIKQVGYLNGNLWEQIELPYFSRNGLLLSFCNTAPLIKQNQIVTIHDAAAFATPKNYSFIFTAWHKILLIGLGKIARKIITDSEFSKSQLKQYCGISHLKIKVIYLGKEHILSLTPDSTILKKNKILGKKYALAVGSWFQNKNFESIIQAVKLMDTDNFLMLFAGKANLNQFNQLESSLPVNMIHLGYVNDNELRALYDHASCLIYPSFYEGFGLPPLEAMACGCPVIASHAGSIPEVCGDGALYCDPHSVEDIAQKLTIVIEDEMIQTFLRQKGYAHINYFSWERCSRNVFRLIEEILTP